MFACPPAAQAPRAPCGSRRGAVRHGPPLRRHL